MAFFDSLGAKLSKTGQKTMQKANDLADITKLNLRTGELNKAVQELYARLGEQYYALHSESPEAALAEICGEIGKANQELEQIRTGLQILKQIKVCPSCGSENSSDARFCSQCSAALPELTPRQEPQLEGQACTQCGAPVLENAQFCTKCGARLSLPKAEPQPAGLPADPPDECFAPQPEDNDNR
ncbi:MAG: zinc ribbon domain-containing protein [Oscillospiraceae bacterium]|nr:zinc ribbon domain-containing protein [Oscillospiraceae bacterium]